MGSRTFLTDNNSPVNVTGIAEAAVPDVGSATDISSVGNGYPNLFDALVQRVNDWTSPDELDDTLLLPAETESTDNGVLLMSPDEHGAPSVVGMVRFYYY